MQGVTTIEQAMPDALHLKTNNTDSELNFQINYHRVMFLRSGDPRTLRQLHVLDELSNKERDAADGFDLETRLKKRLGLKEWPNCGIHGNMVRNMCTLTA